MVRFKMSALVALMTMLLLAISLNAQEKRNSYKIKSFIDESGDVVNVYRYAGFPPKELPLVNTEVPKEIRKDGEKGFFALPNVPSYTWCYGCTATAAAIIAAYYDSFGAPTTYTGPANGGVAPMTNTVWQGQSSQTDTDMCPIAASKMGVDGRATRGHGDDYWVKYLSEATDPYYGAWAEHDHDAGQPCTADFMGTNQWYNWENADGSTTIWSSAKGVFDYTGSEGSTPAWRDGIHGYRLFYEALGFTVDKNYTRTITGYDDPDDNPDLGPAVGGYEFEMYKESIDAGRPVFIQIEGHSMVGFGYDDSYVPPRLYLRDTWDTNTSPTAHYMVWGQKYSNMQHYAISEIILGTECYWAAPENVFALNNNRQVTFTWDDPSKSTKNVSYIVFRDGSQIATGVTTTSYVDNGATDGVHYYSVKAYYIADSFTSYMSKQAAVYVSPSVTSFYDDFESGSSQWLFNPTTGWWGLDTQYKYAGTYSLSDSPGANYKDNSDQLPTKGAIAEVAPGLNFSAAADATCSFWLRYMIEESFDYLHFQACDDGITWETLKTWSLEDGVWRQENISLGLFAGNSNVRFRFILVTDPGYNTQGSNIDNFAITPSSVDSSAPYVYYTKDRDWYSEKADGFEITTRIVDYTGIDYARCYYKVNGEAEVYANPTSVTGTSKDAVYFWKLEEQTEGDLIEFRIETKDTYSTPNTASKGPFQYREGLHQKYDFATVSYYTEIVTTTAQYDQKSYAVKFSSFMDDICGAVVRGYDDASQPNDNEDMLINVWADNAGLPGATLITPFSYDNPATLQDTNAWGYVDLSGYTALDNRVGDYYIGFECGNKLGTASTVTRTTMTQTGEAGEFDFGRAYIQYYSLNGSGLMWEKSTGYNHHIRCITTDKQIEPGLIDTTPGALAKTVVPDGTGSDILNVDNVGGYQLDYTASISYNGFASATTVHENNFNTALGWTPSGTPAWSRVTTWDGGSLNGTGFAKVSAATTGSGTGTGYITSAIQNLSAYAQVTVSWVQKTVLGGGNTAFLQASNDGTNWTTIYTTTLNLGAWNNGDAQSVIVPAQFLTSTARFRFGSALTARSGRYYAIDNIIIGGSVGFNWMTLDGGATTSGTVAVDGSDPMTVGYNATGLADGKYTANIRLASQYSNKSVFVELTVQSMSPPTAPSLVSPSNASNLADITPYFDWSDVASATEYNIVADNNVDFSSPEIDTEVTTSNYQHASNLSVGTYYWKVRSKNAAGYSAFTSTWSVNIQAAVSSYSVNDLAGQADIGGTDSDTFNIGNTGNASLTYSIAKEYVTAKADIPLLNNNFNTGLVWTASDILTWAQTTNSNNLDGTPYARLLAATEGEANGTSAGTLTSPVFDGTTSYEVWIDFDQYANLTSSACTVEYTINGSTWTTVYTNNLTIGAWSNPDHKRIKLPETSATMQVRFTGSMRNLSGSSWNIDNVVVGGLNPANYNWLTVAPLSGSVAVSGSTTITATYNATGMDAGTYNANITVTTNDPYNPSKVIPVQFVVNSGEIIPAVPSNITTAVVGGNIYINWDDAADATNYDVYSSANPYGTFAFLANVSVSEYTYTGTETKMFFYIVSKNATKAETPETIEVKAIKKRTVKDIKEEDSGN